MYQKVGKTKDATEGGEAAVKEGKRLDLSGAQVAASAVAAVLAATLASELGVYGTVVGAGVISVIATCGGPLLQHLFSRTGEKVRGATTRTARPGGAPGPPTDGGYGDATTYGSRVRGRRRSVLAAVVVFAVAMTGITAYELISGQNLSGGKGTTTFGAVVGGGTAAGGPGGGGGAGRAEETGRTPAPDGASQDGRPGTDGGASPSGTPDPSETPGGQESSPGTSPSSAPGPSTTAPSTPRPADPGASAPAPSPSGTPAEEPATETDSGGTAPAAPGTQGSGGAHEPGPGD